MELLNAIRSARRAQGLSQAALAERIGVSRQTILQIEAGRSAPSTALSLQLANALGRRVDELFWLDEESLVVERAPGVAFGGRVVLGRVAGRLVAHGLDARLRSAADGLLLDDGRVRPLTDQEALSRNLLVAGCEQLRARLIGIDFNVQIVNHGAVKFTKVKGAKLTGAE